MTTRFKRILATTDLSPEAASAVSYAGHLAREGGGKLWVLNVPHSTSLYFTDFSPPIDMVNIDAQIEAAARETLESWVGRHFVHVSPTPLPPERVVGHPRSQRYSEEVDDGWTDLNEQLERAWPGSGGGNRASVSPMMCARRSWSSRILAEPTA